MTNVAAFHETIFDTEEARQEAAALPAGRRQWMVKRLLVNYPTFKSVLTNIGRFHRPVAGGDHDSDVIGGLLAEPRSGKTFACERYRLLHPPRTEEQGERYPVVFLGVRDDWTPTHMAEAIYHATGARSIPHLKVAGMISGAIRRLVEAGTELVIVDDAHFALLGTKGRSLANFKSIIKGIADSRACNVLLSGLPDVLPFVEADPQLSGRGDFPRWYIQPLNHDLSEEREQFRLLLRSIDKRLPFAQLSGLDAADYVEHFHRITGGSIGRVMNVVRDAANQAINDGTARIMREHLQLAADSRRRPGDGFRPFYR